MNAVLTSTSAERWVLDFLGDPKENQSLLRELKGGYSFDFEEIDLQSLSRVAGPESELRWREPKAIWEKRVTRMADAVTRGWHPPPLIVFERTVIADGNHRHEALLRAGFKTAAAVRATDLRRNVA